MAFLSSVLISFAFLMTSLSFLMTSLSFRMTSLSFRMTSLSFCGGVGSVVKEMDGLGRCFGELRGSGWTGTLVSELHW
jgi:hypothetical protein